MTLHSPQHILTAPVPAGGDQDLAEDSDDASDDEEKGPASEEGSEDEGHSEEEECPEDLAERAENFKMDLQQCLDDVRFDGSFSAFQRTSQYTNPGLYINGLGTMGLPLSIRDAQAIAAICKKFAFWKRRPDSSR